MDGVVKDRTPDGAELYRAGTVIAQRYQLEIEIGRGAMGAVWAARDLGSDLTGGERVAIKIVPETSLGRAGDKRFQREVASVLALDHPHVVGIRGHGQTPEGDNFIAMELVPGRTLAALLAEAGELPIRRALAIAAQILDAMASAHRLAILHRDLKPANIMLTAASSDSDRAERVKVCDFGLAKFVSGVGARPPDSAVTSFGEVCGTAGYMAPEQARGEDLDGRTDLYAVSVMLFEMLVGRRPFLGNSPFAVVSQHLAARPPSPRALRPELKLPVALDALILRGLAKDREERPCSADVFRAEILQIERDRAATMRRQAGRAGGVADTLAGAPAQSAGPAAGAPVSHARGWFWEGAIGLCVGGVLVARLAAGPVPAARPGVAPPPDILTGSVADVSGATTVAASARVPAPPAVARAPVAADPPPAALRDPDQGALPPRLAITVPSPRRAGGAAMRPRRSPAAAPPANAAETAPASAPVPAPVAASTATPGGEAPVEVVRLEQAEELLANNQVAAACALGEIVAAAQPRLAAARGFLGRCYMRLGERKKARASYRLYLSLAPEARDAAFVRAMIAGSDAGHEGAPP